MASHLLTCDCGENLPVDVGRAGGQVVCTCGRTLDVPTLRLLRHLPTAPVDEPQPATSWSARKGGVAVFLILAVTLGALALVSRLTEPQIPEFQPQVQSKLVDQELSETTPLRAWRTWIVLYRPLAESGFTVMTSQYEPAIRQQIERRRFLQFGMLSAAGVFVALAAVTKLWPAGREVKSRAAGETRRPG